MYYSVNVGMSSVLSTMTTWAVMACSLIGSWFVFKKMGFPGWKGIIPFYNMYILFDEVWEKKKFWTYVVFSVVAVVLSILFSAFLFVALIAAFANSRGDLSTDYKTLFIVMLVLSILSFIAMMVMVVLLMVMQFKLYSRLVKGFGKSTGFAVGLLFVTPVFMMILGLDKSQYFRVPKEEVQTP